MALSLLFIVLRIPIWPRLAKYRATSRARCVQLAFWLFGPLLLAPTACTPGYKNRSNKAELFQKDLLSGAKAFARNKSVEMPTVNKRLFNHCSWGNGTGSRFSMIALRTASRKQDKSCHKVFGS